eukprot:CAMPEP_0113930748 /NCGR_PEP_ID=MMETSP1159-20121227/6134_1 /TAXON_ID=88271 /ORGANISM="Picocystis salinarum" /LENGTH=59 /DNA_ID=CAMNT_0000931589 /DNA_START=78 /DNA_END=258 /DNA_ORIENTATION=- /assembly_acc=CAM_ASM_000767
MFGWLPWVKKDKGGKPFLGKTAAAEQTASAVKTASAALSTSEELAPRRPAHLGCERPRP